MPSSLTRHIETRDRDWVAPLGLQTSPLCSRAPKLLFLAWFFPPARAIASVRAFNVAKYLASLGWEVTVVTLKPSIWRDRDDPREITKELERHKIRRILTDHRWRFLSSDNLNCWNQGLGWLAGGACRNIARSLGVDDFIGWSRAAAQACSTLRPKDVDVIFATGAPFVAFSLARRLSDRLGRPYVLDYRDPWTDNPHVSAPPALSVVAKERSLLRHSAAVTIVSQSWGQAMERRFGLGAKLHVLTNGYDDEELAQVRPYDFGHPALVYTGDFYPPKRAVTPVMAALKRLHESSSDGNSQWRFHYYGASDAHVREAAERCGVSDWVVFHGKVSRGEALSAIRGAAVALVVCSVLASETPSDLGIVPGKLFESLGLGVPTLVIAPKGNDAREIIEETGSGQGFVASDVEGIVHFISEAQRIVSKRTAKTASAGAYSWAAKTAQLDSILRGAMRSGRTATADLNPQNEDCSHVVR